MCAAGGGEKATKVNRVGGKELKSSVQSEDKKTEQTGEELVGVGGPQRRPGTWTESLCKDGKRRAGGVGGLGAGEWGHKDLSHCAKIGGQTHGGRGLNTM